MTAEPRVFCDRSKHELARVERGPGGALSVRVRAMIPGRDGYSIDTLTIREADLAASPAGLTTTAACACGDTYRIEVAPPLRGEDFPRPERLEPITGVRGVSPNRKRPRQE